MNGRIPRRAILGAGLAAGVASLTSRPARAAETVRIIYTNDTHAHLDSFTDGTFRGGGIARRKTALDRIRALGGNIVLVDAGDVFQGTLYFNVWNGIADLAFNNTLGYDVATIGNHEFDKPNQYLADYMRGARFPIVSSNIEVSAPSPLAGMIQPWARKQVGSLPMAFIGVTTNTTPEAASPGPDVRFGDHYAGLQGSADRLAAMGAPVTIGLTHIGYDVDRAIARQLRNVPVIIGGHSHTLVDPTPTVVQDADGEPVLVVQAKCWGEYLGVLDLSFDERGKVVGYRNVVVPLDESIPEDSGFLAALGPWKAGVDELNARIAGSAAVLLDGTTTLVRSRETNLGDLIADLMVARTANAGSRIGMMNGGGIRASIPAGPVTVGRIIEVMPFGNQLNVLTIPGAQVVAALENGVSMVENNAGRFPQVSGIRFAFDPARPAGNRVTRVEVKADSGFASIDPSRQYRIVTNDFMASGGDGYAMFRGGTDPLATGLLLSDMLVDHFQQSGTVSATIDGRIDQPTISARLINQDRPPSLTIGQLGYPGSDLTPIRRPVFALT